MSTIRLGVQQITSYPLATTSWIKMVQKGESVDSTSTIRVGVQLITTYPLAAGSYD